MKKILLNLTLVFIISTINAQTNKFLENITHSLTNYNDYQSYCKYAISSPGGGGIMIESDMTTKKQSNDTLCGFFYYFKTHEKYKPIFGDFITYFNGSFYRSYKGEINVTSILEKPEEFQEKDINYGIIPPIHKSPQLYDFTPYQIGKLIENTLKNNNSDIIQKQDTIINEETCLRFVLKVPNNYGGKRYYITVNNKEYYPLYYKHEYYNNQGETTQKRTAYYYKTKINDGLQENFFSKQNLIYNRGKIKNNNIPEKNPKDLVGKETPKWKLPILGKDELLSNNDLKKKYILLEFTATWCGHCIEAAKFMNNLEEMFQGNTKVDFISVFSSDRDTKEIILNFSKRNSIQSTILYSAQDVADQFYVYSYPNFFLISPEGKILQCYPGYSDVIKAKIIAILKEIIKRG